MDNAVFLQADEKHESLVVDKISEKEERRQELEDEFTYDGYQVVRKELFAHLRDPAVTIRYDSITFNTACIDGLEDTVYVNVLINSGNQRLVVKKCNENDDRRRDFSSKYGLKAILCCAGHVFCAKSAGSFFPGTAQNSRAVREAATKPVRSAMRAAGMA